MQIKDNQQPISSKIIERSEGQLLQHRVHGTNSDQDESEEEEVKPKKRLSKFAQAKLDALNAQKQAK